MWHRKDYQHISYGLFLFFLIRCFNSAFSWQETEVHIPVRIFRDGVPLHGLLKNDFQVMIEGTPCIPKELREIRISLAVDAEHPPVSPRLIILNLQNISRISKDRDNWLEKFFRRFVWKNDRIAIISNHMQFPPRVVLDRENELKRVANIVQTEIEWMQWEMRKLKMTLEKLQKMGEEDVYNIEGEMVPIEGANDRFRNAYIALVNSYKSQFGKVSNENLRALENYLTDWPGEKHVISFIYKRLFPKLKRLIDFEAEDARQFENRLEMETIGSIRLSGAVFHTCLILPQPESSLNATLFEWKPFPTSIELAFSDASRQSSGVTTDSGDSTEFIEEIAKQGGDGYELICPWQGDLPSRESIQVEIAGAGLEIQMGSQTLQPAGIRLESPQVVGGKFVVLVQNYSRLEQMPGRMEMQMVILDSQWQIQLRGKKEFTLDGTDDRIQIPLGNLRKGTYRMIVSVIDFSTKSQDALLFLLKI